MQPLSPKEAIVIVEALRYFSRCLVPVVGGVDVDELAARIERGHAADILRLSHAK